MNYICPICQNEEHNDNAKYCIICGTQIGKGEGSITLGTINIDIAIKEYLEKRGMELIGSPEYELDYRRGIRGIGPAERDVITPILLGITVKTKSKE